MGKLGLDTLPAILTAGALLAMAACGSGAGNATPSPTSEPASTSTPAPTSTSPPTRTPRTTTSATAAPVKQCTTTSLKIALGQGEGAAGHFYVPVVFTNTGGPCRITGYPGVSFYAGVDHHQVGDAATRDPGSAPTVVLRRGQSASAWVSQVNVDLYDLAQCGPTPVTGLRVYPPGNTVPVLLPEPGARACTKHMPEQRPLSVRAVQREADAH